MERVLITWGDGGVRMLSEFSLRGVTVIMLGEFSLRGGTGLSEC